MASWERIVSKVISSVKPNSPDQDIPQDILDEISQLCREEKRAQTLKYQPYYKRLVRFLEANCTEEELRNDDNLSNKLKQWKEGLKALSKYGLNLIASPNHKVYHRIKLSSPFFVYNVKNKCQGGEEILAAMGYHKSPNVNEFQYRDVSVEVSVRTRSIGVLVVELAAVVVMLDDLSLRSCALKKSGQTYSLSITFTQEFQQALLVVGKGSSLPERSVSNSTREAAPLHDVIAGRPGLFPNSAPPSGVRMQPLPMDHEAGQQCNAGFHGKPQNLPSNQPAVHPRPPTSHPLDSLLADIPRRYPKKPPIAREPPTSSSSGELSVDIGSSSLQPSLQPLKRSSPLISRKEDIRKGSCPAVLGIQRGDTGSEFRTPRSHSHQTTSRAPTLLAAGYVDYTSQQRMESVNACRSGDSIENLVRGVSELSCEDDSLPAPMTQLRGRSESPQPQPRPVEYQRSHSTRSGQGDVIVRMYDSGHQRVQSPEIVEFGARDNDYENLEVGRQPGLKRKEPASFQDKHPIPAPRHGARALQHHSGSNSHLHYEPLEPTNPSQASTYTDLDPSTLEGRDRAQMNKHCTNDLRNPPSGSLNPLSHGSYQSLTDGRGQSNAHAQPIQRIDYSSSHSDSRDSSSARQEPYRRVQSHDSSLGKEKFADRRSGGDEWRGPGPNSHEPLSPQKSSLSGEDDSTGGSNEAFGSGDYSKNGPKPDNGLFMTSV